MTDESIINLSDETKSSLRIYATMAGFFVIMAMLLYAMVSVLSDQIGSMKTISIFSSTTLIIIGVTLALLHKRDLFATFFILFAFFNILTVVCASFDISILIATVCIIAALAFLQNRNEQTYIVSGLLLIHAIQLVSAYFDYFSRLSLLLGVLLIAACLYFTIALACERFKLPLRDHLTADEAVPENDGVPVHFKAMGSSIGYLVISLYALSIALYRFGLFGDESLDSLSFVVAIILVITGIIMMVAGRMKGTPFYFVMLGFVFLMMSSGNTYVEFVCLIILGLMMMLRADSRILPGVGLVLFGVPGILKIAGIPPMVGGVVVSIAFLIFTYLVFAVNSNGKLKLI